jgi:hypothetical protein
MVREGSPRNLIDDASGEAVGSEKTRSLFGHGCEQRLACRIDRRHARQIDAKD